MSERSIFTFRKSRLKENKITASQKLFGRESLSFPSAPQSGAELALKNHQHKEVDLGSHAKEGRKLKALRTHAEQSPPVSTGVLSHAILMSCNH